MDRQTLRSRQIPTTALPLPVKAVGGFFTALREGLIDQLCIESQTPDSSNTPPSLPAAETWALERESGESVSQHSLSPGDTHQFKMTISTCDIQEGQPKAQIRWDDRSIDMIGCLFPGCGKPHDSETVEDCARFFGSELEKALDEALSGRDRFILLPTTNLSKGHFPIWLAWKCTELSDQRCGGSVWVERDGSTGTCRLTVLVNKSRQSKLVTAKRPRGKTITTNYTLHFAAWSGLVDGIVDIQSGGDRHHRGVPVQLSDVVARQLKTDLETGGLWSPAREVTATWARGALTIEPRNVQSILSSNLRPTGRWEDRIIVSDCAGSSRDSERGSGLLAWISVSSQIL